VDRRSPKSCEYTKGARSEECIALPRLDKTAESAVIIGEVGCGLGAPDERFSASAAELNTRPISPSSDSERSELSLLWLPSLL